MEPPRDMDQVTGLADLGENLVPRWGFWALEIDKKIASMAADLPTRFGIIVAARAAGRLEVAGCTAGDVFAC